VAETSNHLPVRSEIPVEYKWDLSVIYGDPQAWEVDFRALRAELLELADFQAKFPVSAVRLLKVLEIKDRIGRRLDKLYLYARMRRDEDNADAASQALTDRIQALAAETGEALSFIAPALTALAPDQLAAWMIAEPQLQIYRHFFADLTRHKPHILTTLEERLLAGSAELAEAASNIFGMLDNADLRFPTIEDENGAMVELTKGRYSRFLESPDRKVRQSAFQALYGVYNAYRNTLAATLNASVKSEIYYARNRRFSSALEASLFSDNVPPLVYDNLIATVRSFLPSLHRYLKLRRKMLDLPELHMYDLYTPLIPDYQRRIKYEAACDMVRRGLEPMGGEYLATLDTAFQNAWIDVCENQGKTSGAYAWGAYDTHPYILMNYQEKLHDAFTLAHELGHAMHSHYSNQAQPYVDAGYRIFVAEVASTVNEALLLEDLLTRTSDRQEELYLLNQYLEQFRGTVFRQTIFAEFEKLIHAEVEGGGALTAEWLSAAYRRLNEEYYGVEAVIDPEIDMEWARIPHFYTGFYVYKYATGYAAAISLSQQILKQGVPARERYLQFLKGGDSEYPLDLLRRAGVDMASPEPVHEALNVFNHLVDRMASLQGITL
jgi:oligoendopeptidase F